MALFLLHGGYHNLMVNDPEFENKPTRRYIIIRNIQYKGCRIKVAVPLRSNINANFQRSPNEILVTAPTRFTRPGCWAGFHITKAVPVNSATVIKRQYKKSRPDYILAEQTANMYLLDFQAKVQAFVSRIEKGESIFGAIDFDTALTNMAVITAQRQQQNQTNRLNQSPASAASGVGQSAISDIEVAATSSTSNKVT